MTLELEPEKISNILNEMQEEYKNQKRGIELIKINNAYTLASKKEYHEYIYNIIDKRVKPNLSRRSIRSFSNNCI